MAKPRVCARCANAAVAAVGIQDMAGKITPMYLCDFHVARLIRDATRASSHVTLQFERLGSLGEAEDKLLDWIGEAGTEKGNPS